MTTALQTKKPSHRLAPVEGMVPTPLRSMNMARMADAAAQREHYDWCDRAECTYTADSERAAASHYSAASSPRIEAADALPWRNAPEGAPEIEVRTIAFTGASTGGVEICLEPQGSVQSTSGCVGMSWLTPTEAREFAALVIAAAEVAEGVRPR